MTSAGGRKNNDTTNKKEGTPSSSKKQSQSQFLFPKESVPKDVKTNRGAINPLDISITVKIDFKKNHSVFFIN